MLHYEKIIFADFHVENKKNAFLLLQGLVTLLD